MSQTGQTATNNSELFSKKLLEDKVFHCVACGDLLSVPIIMVKNLGNTCDSCFKSKYQDEVSMRNISLEKVLFEIIVPCKYTGCEDRMNFKLLDDHYKVCKFQTTDCLLQKGGCPWTGLPKDMPKHFEVVHKTHVVECENNSFVLSINLTSEQPVLKLLKNKAGPPYFLQIRPADNNLYYTLCEPKCNMFGAFNSANRYNIKHLSSNNNHVELECIVTTLNKITDTNLASKIDLAYLKEITGEAKTIFVIVKPNNGNIDEKVFEMLECPVCNVIMRPPIPLCATGHSICSICKQQIKDCPTCRSPMSISTRNYALEELTSCIFYPCKYGKGGCEEILIGADLSKHETFCTYRPQSAAAGAGTST